MQLNPINAKKSPPDHLGVSSYRLRELACNLLNTRKFDQLPILAEIATELHPNSWELFRDLEDTFLQIGQKEAAFHYYKKVLKLNPEFKEGQQKIKALERELKKQNPKEGKIERKHR